MHEITTWLQGKKDYNTGLALLEKKGASRVLLTVLGAGDTYYNRNRLITELTKLAPQAVSPQATKPLGTSINQAKKSSVKKTYGRKHISYYPAELHPAFNRQDELYRQVNHLHPQLENLHQLDQGRCTAACKAIVKAWREINSIYRLLDYWDENRVVLPNNYTRPVKKVLTDPVAIMKRVNALRVNISRNKNRDDRMEEIKAWRIELDELLNQVNG